ncbi:MAG TPA: hypothetical protein VEA41_03855 [Salinarimonas sp.]|nr:hypothetical protein [Salinarimonas sp.]
MAVTRYTEGSATVRLSDGLERLARRVLEGAQGAAVRVLEEEAEKVAAAARGQWYQDVNRRTGLTGQIEVFTTIDAARNEVRVGIGSLDTRKSGGKPRWVMVRRASPTSMIKVEVSVEEYWQTPRALRANFHPLPADEKKRRPADVGTGPYVFKANPKAGDGKSLEVELVRKPAKARMTAIAPELAAAFRASMAKGGR